MRLRAFSVPKLPPPIRRVAACCYAFEKAAQPFGALQSKWPLLYDTVKPIGLQLAGRSEPAFAGKSDDLAPSHSRLLHETGIPVSFGVVLKKAGPSTGLIFSTNNSIKVLNTTGVCCAMIADWISMCKKLGRSVKTAGELRGEFAATIGQSKLKISHGDETDTLKVFGLSPGTPEIIDPTDFVALAANLATKSGLVYFSIGTPTLSELHAMGVNNTAGSFEFFDPNVGLHRSGTAAAQSKHIANSLAAKYPDMTGATYIYQF